MKNNGAVAVAVNRVASLTAKEKQVSLQIAPPHFETVKFRIVGSAPYVQHKFSVKVRQMMKEKQEAGSVGQKGKKREPKDFQKCYQDAMYVAKGGWHGIPAPSFRAAMISACRLCGFQMTRAKMAVFCVADGYDDEGVPLVKILKGDPHYHEQVVRNETGVCDIRARPMWDEGWEADVCIRYDADMFSHDDVANLLARAGEQVGIGEGRPDSRNCAGCGWGTFGFKKAS